MAIAVTELVYINFFTPFSSHAFSTFLLGKDAHVVDMYSCSRDIDIKVGLIFVGKSAVSNECCNMEDDILMSACFRNLVEVPNIANDNLLCVKFSAKWFLLLRWVRFQKEELCCCRIW